MPLPPPPPPMPGMKAPGGKPPSGAGRGALLGDITKGARLKKVTQVNDRSAPIVGKVSDGPAAVPMGAPAIPSMGLAPPVPGGANRARSNSDTRDAGSAPAAAPQLAGIFAGGMPKLRKSGGVKTGAEDQAPYASDPESNRGSAPRPPRAAPKAPGPPSSVPPAPPIPSMRPPLNALRGQDSRPNSVASSISGKPKPPPPIGKKPPMPPPSSRKPSGLAPSPARAPPSLPPAPPPLPPSSTSPRLTGIPAPPPLPPSSAPRAPARSTPPPPPPSVPPPTSAQDDDDEEYDPYKYDTRAPSVPPPPPPPPSNGHAPSLAETAARNAFSRTSPAAPPPAPPSIPAPSPPSAPLSRPASQTPLRSMMDSSSYTLTNGGSSMKSPTSSHAGGGGREKGRIRPINDLRWRFQDESQFPRPREFIGGQKRYRAGRGSSVPLDLSAFE